MSDSSRKTLDMNWMEKEVAVANAQRDCAPNIRATSCGTRPLASGTTPIAPPCAPQVSVSAIPSSTSPHFLLAHWARTMSDVGPRRAESLSGASASPPPQSSLRPLARMLASQLAEVLRNYHHAGRSSLNLRGLTPQPRHLALQGESPRDPPGSLLEDLFELGSKCSPNYGQNLSPSPDEVHWWTTWDCIMSTLADFVHGLFGKIWFDWSCEWGQKYDITCWGGDIPGTGWLMNLCNNKALGNDSKFKAVGCRYSMQAIACLVENFHTDVPKIQKVLSWFFPGALNVESFTATDAHCYLFSHFIPLYVQSLLDANTTAFYVPATWISDEAQSQIPLAYSGLSCEWSGPFVDVPIRVEIPFTEAGFVAWYLGLDCLLNIYLSCRPGKDNLLGIPGDLGWNIDFGWGDPRIRNIRTWQMYGGEFLTLYGTNFSEKKVFVWGGCTGCAYAAKESGENINECVGNVGDYKKHIKCPVSA